MPPVCLNRIFWTGCICLLWAAYTSRSWDQDRSVSHGFATSLSNSWYSRLSNQSTLERSIHKLLTFSHGSSYSGHQLMPLEFFSRNHNICFTSYLWSIIGYSETAPSSAASVSKWVSLEYHMNGSEFTYIHFHIGERDIYTIFHQFAI